MRKNVNIKKVRAIERAFSILETFTFENPNLKLNEIVEKTGLSRTTVYRILYTLEQNRVVKYDENNKKYSLGIKIFELGGVFSADFEENKVISHYLDKLNTVIHHTILVGKLDNDKLMYIDKRESRKELRYTSNVGKKRPPNFGILGKILMAYKEPEEIDRLLKKFPLKKYASNSIIDNEKFKKRLKKIRRNQCVIAYSEAIEGVVGVGVPIFKNDKIYASLGVIAPESIMDQEEMENVKNILKDYSAEISRELG